MNWERILKRSGQVIRDDALIEIKSILKEANEPLSASEILQKLYAKHKKYERTFARPESITRLIKKAGAKSEIKKKVNVYWV